MSVDPGQWAIIQSYRDDTSAVGEGLQPGDTKYDLNIRPPDITMVAFIQEMKANTVLTILSEVEIVLESGQQGIRLELESIDLSRMLITEIIGQVVIVTASENSKCSMRSQSDHARPIEAAPEILEHSQSFHSVTTDVKKDIDFRRSEHRFVA
jgi:sugar/nucleoside kinase (ribokinase family)